MSTLVIEDLHVHYGETHAVKGVSLRVENGELCVFLGPSGCGKTSTLRTVAGLVRPSSGRILIDDRVVKRYPRELSAGQAQRVAIGRALIRTPKLWLLDEPLNNLDARLQVETRAVLKHIQRESGITSIYVTHNQEEAQSLADQIVIMDSGLIQQIGTPQEVYDEPTNLFVAGFVGTPPMNFIPCTLSRANGQIVLRHETFGLELEPELVQRVAAADGHAVMLGIRPEDVDLRPVHGGDPASDRMHPRGTVYVIEPQGNEQIVSLQVTLDVLWKVRREANSAAVPLESGQPVELTLRQHRLRLFDANTEQRLL